MTAVFDEPERTSVMRAGRFRKLVDMRGRRRQTGELGARVALALPLMFLSIPATAQVEERRESFEISVNVSLVVLHATVHDGRGRDVPNLRRQDFKVYEDGVAQEVRWFRREDSPTTVGLLVDHSGSMQPKLDDVTSAARLFAQSSNPKDQMFVLNFNENVVSGMPGESRFTDSPAELEAAIARAPAGGKTALYDAVAAGLNELKLGDFDKKVLVVISDGGDNSSTNTLVGVIGMAEQSNAVIYTVGMFTENDVDKNPGVLRRLAEATGGQVFLPKESGDVADICASIAWDIRNQYMVGYVSTNAKQDGTHRTVRLVAEMPGAGRLHVRTRTGYIAGGAIK